MFKVDGVLVPAASVTRVGDDWSFQFTPDQKNWHVYTIEAIATDFATTSASDSMPINGIKTLKKQ